MICPVCERGQRHETHANLRQTLLCAGNHEVHEGRHGGDGHSRRAAGDTVAEKASEGENKKLDPDVCSNRVIVREDVLRRKGTRGT